MEGPRACYSWVNNHFEIWRKTTNQRVEGHDMIIKVKDQNIVKGQRVPGEYIIIFGSNILGNFWASSDRVRREREQVWLI